MSRTRASCLATTCWHSRVAAEASRHLGERLVMFRAGGTHVPSRVTPRLPTTLHLFDTCSQTKRNPEARMGTTLTVRLARLVPPAVVSRSVSVVLLAGAVVAHAATFAVNSTIDAADATPGNGVCESGSGNGVCTLRAAIEEANSLAGPDAVDVPGGVYALLSGQLYVSDDLMVSGAGAATTIIDAGGRSGGIALGPATASIGGMTVQNGVSDYSGGGISNAGTLTLTDSVVSANVGGGIYSEGTLTLENVAIRGNTNSIGGGILSIGQLTVDSSTIADNTADYGGGVFVAGPATLKNSTLSGNSASLSGGGIVAGLCVLFGCVTADVLLSNVTITNNSTASGDGGGVYFFGDSGDAYATLHFRNTVIAGNSDQGGEAPDCAGFLGTSLISDGYNLIGSTAGCGIMGDTTGNLTGVNPNLGPLQNNGGPTPTHAPLPGSPAIDAGNPAGPRERKRGM